MYERKNKKKHLLNETAPVYPGNTNKKTKPEKKKIDQVTTGKVISKKRPISKKFKDLFLSDDMPSIINDVLIPAAKHTLSDMIDGTKDMMLFGELQGRGSRRDKSRYRVSYQNYYDGKKQPSVKAANRARHNFDDIILETRAEGEAVLDQLVELTLEYEQATVADLYDLVGLSGSFTDNKYGWETLERAKVIRVRDGYMLDLPKTILLD